MLCRNEHTYIIPLDCSDAEGGCIDCSESVDNLCAQARLDVLWEVRPQPRPVLSPVGVIAHNS